MSADSSPSRAISTGNRSGTPARTIGSSGATAGGVSNDTRSTKLSPTGYQLVYPYDLPYVGNSRRWRVEAARQQASEAS